MRRRLWCCLRLCLHDPRSATGRGRLGAPCADGILGEVVVNSQSFLDGDGLAQLLAEAPSFFPDASKSFALDARLPNLWFFIILIVITSRFGTNALVDFLCESTRRRIG